MAAALPSCSNFLRRRAMAWRKNIPLGPHPIRAMDGGVRLSFCIVAVARFGEPFEVVLATSSRQSKIIPDDGFHFLSKDDFAWQCILMSIESVCCQRLERNRRY